jgi:hypothetical protein
MKISRKFVSSHVNKIDKIKNPFWCKMDLLKEFTSWNEWKVPNDIFNLMIQYLSPYQCYYCQRYKGYNENFCSVCTGPVLKEYEELIQLYQICLQYVKDGKSTDELNTLYANYNRKYREELYGLKNLREKLSPSADEIQKLRIKHYGIIVHVSEREYGPLDYDNYFRKINYKEYFYHKEKVEEMAKVEEQIHKINSKVAKYFYTKREIKCLINTLLSDLDRYRKVAFNSS